MKKGKLRGAQVELCFDRSFLLNSRKEFQNFVIMEVLKEYWRVWSLLSFESITQTPQEFILPLYKCIKRPRNLFSHYIFEINLVKFSQYFMHADECGHFSLFQTQWSRHSQCFWIYFSLKWSHWCFIKKEMHAYISTYL